MTESAEKCIFLYITFSRTNQKNIITNSPNVVTILNQYSRDREINFDEWKNNNFPPSEKKQQNKLFALHSHVLPEFMTCDKA